MRTSASNRPATCGRSLNHQVATDLAVVVAQPVGKPRCGGQQQEAGRLDGVPGHHHDAGPLEVFDAMGEVGDPGGPAIARR